LLREGNKLYDDKRYNDAEIQYRKALEQSQNAKSLYNLGDALYKQGNYEEAAEKFSKAVSMTKDTASLASAMRNLGNSYLQMKKYDESINAYKNSLKLNPKDEDTRYNLEYAKRMMVQQQQQNKQNKDNKQDKNKDNQNQQQQNQDNKQGDKDKKDQQNKNDEQKNRQNQDNMQEKPSDKDVSGQPKEGKISKEDAERILNALMKQEKEVHKKLKKEKGEKKNFERNW
jgi:tetratricopeptide (TPR) repeat protein